MKLANPLHYPLATLASGVVLVGGIRLAKLPSVVMLPVTVAIATAGATLLKAREPISPGLEYAALEPELQAVLQQAQGLTQRAEALKSEATQLLKDAHQMELLGSIQYACERTHELPTKINHLARRLQSNNSLLSVDNLQQQLAAVEAKRQASAGTAQQQWAKLADSLHRNIDLVRQGDDTRQAQIASLSTLIADAAGVLQQLQNKLRTANLDNVAEATELRALSQEFNSFQENLELLIS
ncbi:MAG: hypothetical protein F6K19_43045 [Cyanothece sp. SIO1E1]|nr:hypothetical protein [Cyanothece sp. SIO1E1]